MSDLTTFRDHCRTMATAEHKPGCQEGQADAVRKWTMAQKWGPGWGEPDEQPTPCPGCNSEADRALFARLAAEVDDYLDPHPTLWEDPA